MTGEAHARPFEVIDLTSDNESQNGDTRARRAAQNSRSVKDSQYANIPSSNHGLPEEYKWKRPSSHKNSSRTNLSDYKWHESPKIFDAMLNKSHNVSNKALHRKSSDMDSGGAAPMPNYPPILPGATIESRNFGQNNKCGHQSLPSGLFAARPE
ncbi:uncharacterized protein LY89DRAFT_335824 [Mollisia scopiformis]|uniref:Uncharacterized protein n=1 Tax=Mollisia scopiformis TaxID=149040 RepID=A0A132B9U2_MOLSC|nr:uncharacterized protein LY89DRAFT_335824 [Mollisia scopiformis]KUJ08634.1 hypothetical protein LY89DRAFT_335824 [Mollisia scopiformis]